jgi:glycogen phosphorylase
MKVLVNGGLNLSVLDGWWAEAYAPDVGWALGDGREHGDDPGWDVHEADALFALLEREVVPAFYERDERGVPTGWVARVRESLRRLTPRFSASRMVREYTERYYLPAAAADLSRREAGQRRPGAELETWRSHLAAYWGEIRFGQVRVETVDGRHLFQAHVYFGELDPEAVAVELYADPPDAGASPLREVMQRSGRLEGAVHGYAYTAQVPADRPSGHYTPRVIPFHPLASVPLEAAQILWYR